MASAFSLVARKIFGSKNEREIKRLRPDVEEINRLEPEISELSDDELRAKIAEWKAKHQRNRRARAARRGDARDRCRRSSPSCARPAKRTLGQRHFDVQLIGGMVLHQGRIAEMKTGEGKTLVATLPAVLNALSGRGVHVVTVNDYLARRDSEWMGRIYNFLGLTRRRHRPRPDRPGAQGRLRRRHHLRPEQRVRLRLPARQHEVQPRGLRPARAQLRDRGRGRLDPDRRGAHAADHLGRVRRIDRHLLRRRPRHPAPQGRRALHHRREDAHRRR